MEREVEQKLPFLDILLDNSKSSLVTTVFRKKTFTRLLANYLSFAPLSYKLGVIRTLVDSRPFPIMLAFFWALFG